MTVRSIQNNSVRPILRGLITLGLVLAHFGALEAAAADAAQGKNAYVVCGSCHGQNGEGNPALNGPRIAGQEDWYIARQLEGFRAGYRGTHPKDTFGQSMRGMASTVSDPTAQSNVIAYIATLDAPPNKPTVSGDVAAGKTAYIVCAACHGQNGEGVKAMNGPRLAGQDDWYLVRQLKNYKAGIRGKHPQDTHGATMAGMAVTLANDEAINNVVAYINSLAE